MTPIFGFVSTGDKTAMYTFRVMYDVMVVINGVNRVISRDYYHQNLSTDKDKANRMAQQFCDAIGIPFKGAAEFDLQEIKRRTSEEIAEQLARAEKAAAEQHVRYVQKMQDDFENGVKEGVFLTGKFTGKTAAEVSVIDPDYLFWIASQYFAYDVPTRFTVGIELAKRFITENNFEKPGHIGAVDEKVEIDVTLFNKIQMVRGQFPSMLFLARTDTGETVKWFTMSKKFTTLPVGQRLKVGGIVKAHEEWKGKCSTALSKPKLVELDLFQA